MRSLDEVAHFTDDVEGASASTVCLIGSAPVADWPGGAIFAIGNGSLRDPNGRLVELAQS